MEAWKKMKKPFSRSEDAHGISNSVVNLAIANENFVMTLANLYNICIKSNNYPKSLKIAKIIPVSKITNATTANDLRPISILPVFSKIFDKCLYQQLSSHFFNNNLIHNTQFGFRPNHSTHHALLVLTDSVYKNMNNNFVNIIASIDVAKAFDTTSREILCQKLIRQTAVCGQQNF